MYRTSNPCAIQYLPTLDKWHSNPNFSQAPLRPSYARSWSGGPATGRIQGPFIFPSTCVSAGTSSNAELNGLLVPNVRLQKQCPALEIRPRFFLFKHRVLSTSLSYTPPSAFWGGSCMFAQLCPPYRVRPPHRNSNASAFNRLPVCDSVAVITLPPEGRIVCFVNVVSIGRVRLQRHK